MENEDLNFSFNLIMDLAQIGSIFFGLDGIILDCNQHAARIMGITCEDLIGKGINFFDKSGIFEELKNEGILKNHQLTVKRNNGEIGFILVDIYVVRDSDGNKIGYREFFIDITNDSLIDSFFRLLFKDDNEKYLKINSGKFKKNRFLESLSDFLLKQDELKKIFKEKYSNYFIAL